MLLDHLFGRRLWSHSDTLLLMLLLGFRVNYLGIVTSVVRLLLGLGVVVIALLVVDRHRLPVHHILFVLGVGLHVDIVRSVKVHIAGTYG
jgi:hypothetical protein